MDLPDDLSIRPALFSGLRQAESVRDALIGSLVGLPFHPLDTKTWLRKQGIDLDLRMSPEAQIGEAIRTGFMKGVGIHPERLVRGSNAPTPEMIRIGAERSGAEDTANFMITSAFVRLLGAWEQFELDVLKVLFYHRPSGLLGSAEENEEIHANPEVIFEHPKPDPNDKNKQLYTKPVIWTWLRKHAESYPEREKIFKNVFKINPLSPKYKYADKQSWYDKRNAIAHGRAGVIMTLADYIEVEILVAVSMLHVSEQCRSKLRVIV